MVATALRGGDEAGAGVVGGGWLSWVVVGGVWCTGGVARAVGGAWCTIFATRAGLSGEVGSLTETISAFPPARAGHHRGYSWPVVYR